MACNGFCYGLNVNNPQNLYVETYVPSVMMLGDGALGKWLCLAEVLKVELHDGISALIKKEETRACSLSAIWRCSKKATIDR